VLLYYRLTVNTDVHNVSIQPIRLVSTRKLRRSNNSSTERVWRCFHVKAIAYPEELEEL